MSRQTVVPSLRYEDANEAIRWLHDAFGITEHFVVRNEDGSVAHAQLAWRGSLVMLGDLHGDQYDLPPPSRIDQHDRRVRRTGR